MKMSCELDFQIEEPFFPGGGGDKLMWGLVGYVSLLTKVLSLFQFVLTII